MLYRVLLMCDARITNNSNRAWNRYLSASVAVPTRIAAKPVALFTARALFDWICPSVILFDRICPSVMLSDWICPR